MNQSHLHRKNRRPLFISLVFGLLALLLTSIIALANENKVTVMTETLNVRYGPGLSHEILTQVNENDQLNVLGEEHQWYKVRLETDQIGWVASWLVENEEVSINNQVTGRITASDVNVRRFSTTDSGILGTVYEGQEFQVLYRENGWVQILFGQRVAWIHSDLIEISETHSPVDEPVLTEETLYVQAGLTPTNIRTSPTIESSVITTLREAEEFEVLNEENDWYEIMLTDGTTGYVASWVTETVAPSESADTEGSETVTSSHYATSLAEATIVIDAGHGGYDPGAVAASGFTEKDIALSTSLLLAEHLEDAGANVILTRDTDDFISLNDRVYYAHRAKADAFISLHYDAVETANSMSGTTTYYYSENERELAETVNHYLSEHGPLKNNGVRQGNYFVLRDNAQPSILLELGYLDNDYDITVVNTPDYQRTVAEAIYQALDHYFSP